MGSHFLNCQMLITVDILHSWYNSYIGFLFYRVPVNANCKLLNLQLQAKMANQNNIASQKKWHRSNTTLKITKNERVVVLIIILI